MKIPAYAASCSARTDLFIWGDTAHESYVNTLEVIERCAGISPGRIMVSAGTVFDGKRLIA